MAKAEKKNWIKGAVKRPGALTAKAKAAGMTTREYADAHAKDKGLTGKQARLAKVFAGFRKKGKK